MDGVVPRLTQILRDELVAVVHDEDPAHVQLDVVLLFLVLKEVEGRTARHEDQRAELQLTLHREVLWKGSTLTYYDTAIDTSIDTEIYHQPSLYDTRIDTLAPSIDYFCIFTLYS